MDEGKTPYRKHFIHKQVTLEARNMLNLCTWSFSCHFGMLSHLQPKVKRSISKLPRKMPQLVLATVFQTLTKAATRTNWIPKFRLLPSQIWTQLQISNQDAKQNGAAVGQAIPFSRPWPKQFRSNSAFKFKVVHWFSLLSVSNSVNWLSNPAYG